MRAPPQPIDDAPRAAEQLRADQRTHQHGDQHRKIKTRQQAIGELSRRAGRHLPSPQQRHGSKGGDRQRNPDAVPIPHLKLRRAIDLPPKRHQRQPGDQRQSGRRICGHRAEQGAEPLPGRENIDRGNQYERRDDRAQAGGFIGMTLTLPAHRQQADQGAREARSDRRHIDAGQQPVDQIGGNVIRAEVVTRHIPLPSQQGIAAAREHQRDHRLGRIAFARAQNPSQHQQRRHHGDHR